MRRSESLYHPSAVVVLAGDDPGMQEVLGASLEAASHTLARIRARAELAQRLSEQDVDAIVIDAAWLEGDEPALLQPSMLTLPEVPVIVLAATEDEVPAVIRESAYDVLPRPVPVARAVRVVRNAVREMRLRRQRDRFIREANGPYRLLGSSGQTRMLQRVIEATAIGQRPVLIMGEQGTGKRLVARLIHVDSRRKAGPFIVTPCAEIPEALIDNELFGFTPDDPPGRSQRRYAGAIEQAHGGTLVLNQFNALSLMIQGRVARLLHDRDRMPRVGNSAVMADVRFVATMRGAAEEEAEAGNLRRDLLAQFEGTVIRLRPLRERPEDLLDLLYYFVQHGCARLGIDGKLMDPEALELLTDHPWPGNVLELRRVAERLVLLAPGEIVQAADVQRALLPTGEPDVELVNLRQARAQFEADYIRQTIGACSGDLDCAATALGLTRRALWMKMHRVGVAPPA